MKAVKPAQWCCDPSSWKTHSVEFCRSRTPFPQFYMDMLRFLTHKLRSQTLDEVQPFQPKVDDDRDSGTESDEENIELEEIERQIQQQNRINTSKSAMTEKGSSSVLVRKGFTPLRPLNTKITELSDSDHDTSDFERQNSDFERHSSEEELANINNTSGVKELNKRKWSQVNRHSFDDYYGSSDDEVWDLLSKPQPVSFSSSPPKGIQRIERIGRAPPEKFRIANVTPLEVCAVSPRKRHRQSSLSDSNETVIQRPCLDFEKMQQKYFKSSGKTWKRIARRD
ncbi:uncharacterized protein LOC135484276 isoform X1 [Lineus longissimus]|uniref:uncharacterized protein LOC135484276 isoform X1 n=1 Tax=Lineus longissimus TaxID=88925 RepID=UPI002B4DF458